MMAEVSGDGGCVDDGDDADADEDFMVTVMVTI